MKTFQFFLVLFFQIPFALHALQVGDKLDSLTTADGKEYISVTVREINAEGISIIHESGVKRIAAKDLTPEMQKTLGLDLNAAEDAMRKRIAAENAARRNLAEKSIVAISNLKNTRRIEGTIMQVIMSENSVIVEISEESYVISSSEERAKRTKEIDRLNHLRMKDGVFDPDYVSQCDLRKSFNFKNYSDIYYHVCNHVTAKNSTSDFICISKTNILPKYRHEYQHDPKPETAYVLLPSVDGIVDGMSFSKKVVVQGVKQYESILGNTKSVRTFKVVPETDPRIIKQDLTERELLKKRIIKDRIIPDVIISGKVLNVIKEENAIVVQLAKYNHYQLIVKKLQGGEKICRDDTIYRFSDIFSFPTSNSNVWIDVRDISQFYDGREVKLRIVKSGTKSYKSGAKSYSTNTVYKFKEISGEVNIK